MSEITINKNGEINVNIDKISKITIDHIHDVISHRIMRSDGITVHEIEFIKNGKCYLSYTAQGKIVACSIKNMNTNVDIKNGIIILRPKIS
jgi:hypothetical protein